MKEKQFQAFAKALESMQKQDKDLYKQLLILQENIRSLKVELKKEREECEEAFRDLQEISLSNELTENRRDKSAKPKEQQPKEKQHVMKADESQDNIKEASWKHDRQDSGISVKICDVEGPVEPTTKSGIPSKPVIILHSKQDSGILIDEEAVSETKLLSRLVQSSSRLFSKAESRKTHSVQNSWWPRQVDKWGITNNKNHHSRSRSSNDLCMKTSRSPTFSDFNSSSRFRPMHSHTKSCPSTSTKKLGQETSEYKVVPSHETRPKKRSASVVDLNTLNKASIVFERSGLRDRHETDNRASKAKSEPDLFVARKQDQPLRAVLVSATEVSVSTAHGPRGNPVSRQNSLNERIHSHGTSMRPANAKGPHRRFSVVGTRAERVFNEGRPLTQFDNGAMVMKDSRFLSTSFQFPRNHVRHLAVPETVEMTRRRQSLRIRHISSKSWDGSSMERPRELGSLLRSTSQVSLV